MIKWIVLTLILFHHFPVHSQEQLIDSLTGLVGTTGSDTAEIRVLNRLSQEFAGNDPELSFKYANRALELSEKANCLLCKAVSLKRIGAVFFYRGKLAEALEQYKKALAIVERIGDKPEKVILLKALGTVYSAVGEYEQAMTYFRKSFLLAKYIADSSGISRALLGIGLIYDSQGDPKTALNYYLDALKFTKPGVEEKHRAGIFNNIGLVYYFLGNHGQSLSYYLRTLEICDKTGDKRGQSLALNNLGMVHETRGDNEKALDYYRQSLNITEKLGDRYGTANALNNIGKVYYNRKNFQKAIEYYSMGLTIRRETDDPKGVAGALNNLGISYVLAGDNVKAKKYYEESMKICESIGDREGVANALGNIGSIYDRQHDFDMALQYISKSLNIAKEIGRKDLLIANYENLATVLAKKGDFKNAFLNYQKYSSIKDSLLNDQTGKQITEMQAKYESEKKEKAILLLKKDKKIQMAEVSRQRILRNSFIAASFFALLLAFILYNRYRFKQRANKKLAHQNEQIRQQKNLIELQKQDITDSIEYASNIQRAMLPSEDEIKELLPECFVLYKPKAIVSGDFYYLTPLPLQAIAAMAGKGLHPLQMERGIVSSPHLGGVRGGLLLCTADCTGHGVPGAFMSMLCTALLNESVNDKGIIEPDKIFEEVRRGIIVALKQKGKMGEAKDGMDATLISLAYGHIETQFVETQCVVSLQIACANNPVYIVSSGVLKEITPDRFPVGVYESGPDGYREKSFTLHTAQLQKGDMIYTLTDGFEDQLGGSPHPPFVSPQKGEVKSPPISQRVDVSIPFYGKKFKSKRLKELFSSIAEKPIAEQKDILEKTFDDWKGKGEQTDDVTVIGIRI